MIDSTSPSSCYFSTPFCSKMLQALFISMFSTFPLLTLPAHHFLETTSSEATSDLHAANSGGQLLVLTCPGLSAAFSTTARPLGNVFFTWLQDSTLLTFLPTSQLLCQFYRDSCLTASVLPVLFPHLFSSHIQKDLPQPKSYSYRSQWAQTFLSQCTVQILSLYFVPSDEKVRKNWAGNFSYFFRASLRI